MLQGAHSVLPGQIFPNILRRALAMTIAIPAEPPSHVKLPSGDLMPTLGLGCWQSTPEELSDAVEFAIKAGYKHIDGATIYGNEKALGEGIKRSGAKREDLWITTKLWNNDHRPADVLKACRTSLDLLGLEYVDLWLMHYPASTDVVDGKYFVNDVSYTDTWKAMEQCVEMGLVRNIGVSNFSKVELETLLASCKIRPAVHQLERHPYLPQNAFMKWHKEIGLHVTAYSPLGNTNPSFAERDALPPILKNSTVREVGEKYGLSPANVLISLQLSEGCSVLPKSVSPQRILENKRVIQLSPIDIESINESCKGLRCRYCDFSEFIGYKYYDGLDDSN